MTLILKRFFFLQRQLNQNGGYINIIFYILYYKLGVTFYPLNLIIFVIHLDSIQKIWISISHRSKANIKNQYPLKAKQITNTKKIRGGYLICSSLYTDRCISITKYRVLNT